MLDPTVAARIARSHGLGLSDAAALSRMTDNESEAEQVAAAFVGPPPEGVSDRTAEPTTGDEFAAFFNAATARSPGALAFAQTDDDRDS